MIAFSWGGWGALKLTSSAVAVIEIIAIDCEYWTSSHTHSDFEAGVKVKGECGVSTLVLSWVIAYGSAAESETNLSYRSITSFGHSAT